MVSPFVSMEFYTLAFVCFILAPLGVISSQVCCPDVGCFQTDGPFKHLPKPKCVEKFGITLGLYTRSNQNYPLYIERTGDLPDSYWREKGRVVFLVHGYMNDFESNYMIGIKDRILKEEDARVIKVDWKSGANSVYYPNSAANTRTVGAEIAFIIQKLIRDHAYTEPWCIGFSLGAHACGFAGNTITLSRITGLDPAGPWFAKYDEAARLSPDDAKFVDVIHTDGTGFAAYYGMLQPCGHVDFYPNGGNNQPGCWTELPGQGLDMETGDLPTTISTLSCSHSRAYKFFLESFDGCFASTQSCAEEKKIPNSSCKPCFGSGCPKMGYMSDHMPSLKGLYYLETKSKSPYCIQG